MSLLAADTTIESDRLILRRITVGDLAFFERLHLDPEVAKYLAHGRPRGPDETHRWFEALRRSYADLQLGHLAIVRKSDGTLLGRTGVSHLETEIDPQPDGTRLGYYFPERAPADRQHVVEHELGYTLDRAAWGKGYGREAVGTLWNYVATRRQDLRVISIIHPENTRSIKLAMTFGVRLVDRCTLWNRPFDRYAWPSPRSGS